MNARWFRDNLSVLIFSLVFVSILTGLIVFLRHASEEQTGVVQKLDTQRGELGNLQAAKIYPSPENVMVITNDLNHMKRLNSEMFLAALHPSLQAPGTVTENPLDF